VLSPAFGAALAWAVERHAGQVRHNTGTPYVSHLLSTAAIVLEEEGTETEVIAALLHDVLEDTSTTREELRRRFGDDVYRIVDDCTDADSTQRAGLGWRDRKALHLRRMALAPPGSQLVIAADKVSSLQSLIDDLARYSPEILASSARSGRELLGNYQDVREVLASALTGRAVLVRLDRLIAHLETELGPKTGDQAERR
jgi:(p)ppGpp synthase/HD superfamily hydrolase